MQLEASLQLRVSWEDIRGLLHGERWPKHKPLYHHIQHALGID